MILAQGKALYGGGPGYGRRRCLNMVTWALPSCVQHTRFTAQSPLSFGIDTRHYPRLTCRYKFCKGQKKIISDGGYRCIYLPAIGRVPAATAVQSSGGLSGAGFFSGNWATGCGIRRGQGAGDRGQEPGDSADLSAAGVSSSLIPHPLTTHGIGN